MGPVAWRLCPPNYYDLGLALTSLPCQLFFLEAVGPVAWRLCPPDYYDLGLEERRATSQLCKACLFKNRNFATNTTTTTMVNDSDQLTVQSHHGPVR